MALSYLKLFYDFGVEIEPLTMEERGRLLTALLTYASSGEVPTELLTGNERFLFPVCRQRIDRDNAAYDRMVETNRMNGAKGGRPRKNPPVFSETEKSQDKDKDQDEVKDKGEDKDNRGKVPGTGAAAPTPTLQEVQALGKAIAQSVDAERFWNHYQANGWRSNGAPIRDWKAMLRQWELENRKPDPRSRAPPAPAADAMNYTQREYRDDDFGDDFFIDLDRFGQPASS